jgi:hypothetical protein
LRREERDGETAEDQGEKWWENDDFEPYRFEDEDSSQESDDAGEEDDRDDEDGHEYEETYHDELQRAREPGASSSDAGSNSPYKKILGPFSRLPGMIATQEQSPQFQFEPTSKDSIVKTESVLKLPPYPNVFGVEDWMYAAHVAMRQISSQPNITSEWFSETRVRSMEELANSGPVFRVLDDKLSAAMLLIAPGHVKRRMQAIAKDMYKQGMWMKGRQMVRLMLEDYRLTPHIGGLVSMQNLFHIQYPGDNRVEQFLYEWDAALSTINHGKIDKDVVRGVLMDKLENGSHAFQPLLAKMEKNAARNRMQFCSYDYLIKKMWEHIEAERMKQNRLEWDKQHKKATTTKGMPGKSKGKGRLQKGPPRAQDGPRASESTPPSKGKGKKGKTRENSAPQNRTGYGKGKGGQRARSSSATPIGGREPGGKGKGSKGAGRDQTPGPNQKGSNRGKGQKKGKSTPRRQTPKGDRKAQPCFKYHLGECSKAEADCEFSHRNMTADEKAEFEKFKKRREDKRSKSPGPARKGKGKGKRPSSQAKASLTPCAKWANGNCTYGDNCRFSHVRAAGKGTGSS